MVRTQSKKAEEHSCRWGTWAGGQHTTSQCRLASNLCRGPRVGMWSLHVQHSWLEGEAAVHEPPVAFLRRCCTLGRSTVLPFRAFFLRWAVAIGVRLREVII